MKMHPSCLLKVEEIIKGEDDTVKYIIRNLCDLISPRPRIADLINEHPQFCDEDPIGDGRLERLTFTNFRTYPGEKDYGLSFVNYENKVSSVFLVGVNGSGKSTLYTALEQLYTGESSYAKLMANDKPEYLSFGFAKNIQDKANQWALDYQLAENGTGVQTSSIENLKSPIAVPAFFCSDIDIQKMKDNKNLFHWILEQMGYGKLKVCLDIVKDMLGELRTLSQEMESNTFYTSEDYSEIMDAVLEYKPDLHDDEIMEYSNQMEDTSTEHRLFNNRWDEINTSKDLSSENQLDIFNETNGLSKDESLNFRSRKEALRMLYKKLSEQLDKIKGEGSKIEIILALGEEQRNAILEEDFWGSSISKSDLDYKIPLFERVESCLQRLQDQIVREFIEEYGKDIEQTMSEFSNHGEKFEFSKENINEVNLSIHCTLKGFYDTSPHEYFNEFRFKLYCITLKLAIAFNWMLNNKKSLPIVIDDVFNANDFENSIKLEQFAYFIKKMYNDKVVAKGFSSDLQMILTTHDELVVDSFRRGFTGLAYSDMASMKMEHFPLIVGRIYRLEEIDCFHPNNPTEFKSIYQYV